MDVDLQEGTLARRGNDYKSGRLNYVRANFEGLREFFERTDWRAIINGKTAQEKYEIFLKRYREGVEKYVPKYKPRDSKYTWYNDRCAEVKRAKDRTWRKLKKQRNEINRDTMKQGMSMSG